MDILSVISIIGGIICSFLSIISFSFNISLNYEQAKRRKNIRKIQKLIRKILLNNKKCYFSATSLCQILSRYFNKTVYRKDMQEAMLNLYKEKEKFFKKGYLGICTNIEDYDGNKDTSIIYLLNEQSDIKETRFVKTLNSKINRNCIEIENLNLKH